MPPQGAAYNVDWVLSNTSNVHVANDRAWFTSYIPFQPTAEVHGIGTVVLPTRIHRQGKSNKPSREITLHNVLYAPRYTANIFAMSMEPDLVVPLSLDVKPIVKRGTDKVLGLVVFKTLWRVWLKGQSQNQSSLDSNGNRMYYFHASWPEEEIKKYNNFVAESKAKQASKSDHEPPLTTEEKEFLKKHYGDEFKFLLSYELSIYKEDDREEGRRILRALMSDFEAEADALEDSEDDDRSIESNDFLADLEQDPTSHVADYKFSADQLDYVEVHYGHSGSFMRCYGLKPWDDKDCDEAVSIIKAFMSDPEDEG
ncbi:hypothetical protein E4T50_09489 [Aureobasidium sp. EXF-12298]|nr:hypothetical protein E4T50_09489 [Aureobasidium sp. EXF-12298]KAI4757720.1 hypothetical protein E4T51_09243 [Aureobasidium sp. EXF-12344]KAI4774770.1 hypothetical protein E4T52_10263 [Aureobasidium sp. EXF-3400]